MVPEILNLIKLFTFPNSHTCVVSTAIDMIAATYLYRQHSFIRPLSPIPSSTGLSGLSYT